MSQYQPIAKHKSRRAYRREKEREYGCWFCIRLDGIPSDTVRKGSFEWCADITNPWGCDKDRRRYYFSRKSDAVMFKLTFGGETQ